MINRISTGIKNLDKALQGGIVEHSRVLVSGPAGSGKTLVGLHFLAEGARNNEKCVYISLEETPKGLLAAASQFKPTVDTENHIKNGMIELQHVSDKLYLTESAFSVICELIKSYDDVSRIVVDNVTILGMLANEDKRSVRLGLNKLFAAAGEKTLMLLCESDRFDAFGVEAYAVDTIFHIKVDEIQFSPIRQFLIPKMKLTNIAYQDTGFELKIGEDGLSIESPEL